MAKLKLQPLELQNLCLALEKINVSHLATKKIIGKEAVRINRFFLSKADCFITTSQGREKLQFSLLKNIPSENKPPAKAINKISSPESTKLINKNDSFKITKAIEKKPLKKSRSSCTFLIDTNDFDVINKIAYDFDLSTSHILRKAVSYFIKNHANN